MGKLAIVWKSLLRSPTPPPFFLNFRKLSDWIKKMKEQKSETEKSDLSVVYIPPINFGMVSPGIYRSGFPNKVRKTCGSKKKEKF
jgi:hypothetical protein